MRLIDADILIEKLKSYAECDWNKSLCVMLPSVVDDCIEFVDEQPTAYSVDKAVEELEIERKTANNTYNSFNMDVDLGRVFGLEKAIKIVKQGIVSDDVCEWEKDEHSENDNPAEWIICPHKPKRIFSKDIKYCPYCGKKIKLVE